MNYGDLVDRDGVDGTGAILRVPQAELDDLRERLIRTRWPGELGGAPWEGGTDAIELRRLVDRWVGGYDWRLQEAAINALESRLVDVAGTAVHVVRYEGEHRDALPIVLTHGWPSSFLEFRALAVRLATPSLHGGDPRDAFTVIVPSLPGFGLSPSRPPGEGLDTAELWHRLMRDELGFTRYGAHGGDLGAGVTTRLGATHPEAVVGIHLLAVADPVGVEPASLHAEERAYLESVERWFAEDGGYEHEQMTRPVTLGYGLSDSPVGLLAWIVEKYREWSDCDGVLARTFSDDDVLTQASLYWFTNTIATSFAPYYAHAQGRTPSTRRVTVPTGVAVFPHDLVKPPRSWAERNYDVTRYSVMPRGGHFAAHEQPELLGDDLVEFFRPLR